LGGGAAIDAAAYDKLYARALDDPQAFGRARPPAILDRTLHRVKHTSFDAA